MVNKRVENELGCWYVCNGITYHSVNTWCNENLL